MSRARPPVARRLRPWGGVALMVAAMLRVWAGLDDPLFMAWYLETLPRLAGCALAGLVAMCLWSLLADGRGRG